MAILKICATGPRLMDDGEGNTIDIGLKTFEKNPEAIFEVPNNNFWQMRIFWGWIKLAGTKKDEPEKLIVKRRKAVEESVQGGNE